MSTAKPYFCAPSAMNALTCEYLFSFHPDAVLRTALV